MGSPEQGRARGGARVAVVTALLALAALLAVAATSGCTSTPEPAAPVAAYDGPLWVAPDPALRPDVDPGAAGRVVSCDQPVLGQTYAEPFDGGGEVGETAQSGLDEGRDDGLWSGLDEDAMREVRTEPDRVLFTYTADGRVLQAVVMRRGRVEPGRGAGADGIAWWPESSARCDVVEYPDGLAESRGAEVWTDARGHRVTSHRISSTTSDGRDCFERGDRTLRLSEGDDDDRVYAADSRKHPDAVDEASRADVALPADAVDSGFAHGDEHLWFSADRRRAYVGTADGVDVWPRLTDGFGCA